MMLLELGQIVLTSTPTSLEIFNEIEQLIGTIGFPVVCVIFMWRKITDSDEKQTALLIELTSAIKNLTEYIKGGKKE